MRDTPLIVVAIFCMSGAVSADDTYLDARRLAAEGAIQPLELILDRIQAAQKGSILEVELDRDHGRMIYEIEMLDDYGAVWELKVDAVSGVILEREVED